jgi:hypothetical protein
MFASPEDGELSSQLYAYSASTWEKAIAGQGRLRVWKPLAPLDGDPSSNNIALGETTAGRFVTLRASANRDAATLEARVQARRAFDFVRLEDLAQSPDDPGVLWFTDTGAEGEETVRGRLYRLDVKPRHPNRGILTLILDGDAGSNLVNPDNLDVAGDVLVIQDDRNEEHRGAEVRGGYGRVLRFDASTGAGSRGRARRHARRARPGLVGVVRVIDASPLLGRGWWLLDGQAHETEMAQPGPSLEPDSGVGEGGQLLAARIPGT